MARTNQRKMTKVGGRRLGAKSRGTGKRHASAGRAKATPGEYLKKPELRRLALRAGNTKVASLAYGEIRELFMAPMPDIMRKAMELVAHRRGKTVKRRDIDYILKQEADAGRLPRPYGDARH